jgi:hypothetical protein
MNSRQTVTGIRIYVPTYYGHAYPDAIAKGLIPEFTKPFIPVLARPADGLRIVLGSHEFFDTDIPDVQIERRPNGWAVFLHPLGGSDASGYVYFLDDGRSFVVPENGATPTIKTTEWKTLLSEVDRKLHDPGPTQ